MWTRPLCLPSVLLCFLCACAKDRDAAPAPAAKVSWPFDDAPAGRAPAGWTPCHTGEGGDAAWAVAADAAAPSPPQVLRMPHAKSPSKTYNLAVLDEASFTDVTVSARVRADAGEEDQGGGVVWRLVDADNYYICRLNPLEGNFRVYKVVAGVRTQLHTADLEADEGRWYVVSARMVGDHIECAVDGKALLQATDATFRGAGKVGLWTKADAATSFDDFTAAAASPQTR
jgi:hypothetical protein